MVVDFAERPGPHVQDFYPTTTCLVAWDEVSRRAADGGLLPVAGHPLVPGSGLVPQVHRPPDGGQWVWLETRPASGGPGTLRAAGLVWAAGALRAATGVRGML